MTSRHYWSVEFANLESNRNLSAGIGEALTRSAASFSAANTDLSQSIALITGSNEVVQDPSKIGNMWKTVSARIRGASLELEMAGEDTEGMVTSTSKLRDLIKGMTGFDIMADEAGTQFKSIYDIVVGIGEVWDSLSDIDQAGLLETLAGKNHANSLAAALNNVEQIKAAYATAENSAGSAAKENERYMESINGRIGQLKASFQEFSTTLMNTDFVKGIVSGAQQVLEVLNKIVSTIGTIPTLLAGAGIAAFIKNFARQAFPISITGRNQFKEST